MLDFKLEPNTPLDGASKEYSGFAIRELPNLRILSVAANASQNSAASAALDAKAGLAWPSVGSSTSNGHSYCLGLQAEQVFLLHEYASEHAEDEHRTLVKELASTAMVTDQSDSWVGVEVSGVNRLAVLERICPINLHDEQFTDGAVARTIMEHLGVIIVRRGDTLVLLCARSFADSLWHALTQSAEYVL